MISRNGVCYDLQISPFRHTENHITYVFSSELHKVKFIERLEDNRNAINLSLTNRFNIDVDVTVLADLLLYRKVETRGFLIVIENEEMLCQENLIYVGGNVTSKPLTEQ